jgi:uncharacterized protein
LTDSNSAAPVRRVPIALCLALIFIYPLLAVPLQAPLHEVVRRFGRDEARFAAEGFAWLYAVAVLAIALFWERRTLASIGLRKPTLASLGFGIGAVVAIYIFGGLAGYVVYFVLHAPERAPAQIAALLGGSLLYALSLGVRAGVIEEIFFRGLAIEQLTVLTGRRWLSALIATIVFVVMHALFFDWVQLVPIAAISVVLAVLYLWRHDLWANIIAHAVVDSISLTVIALHLGKLAR